MRLWPVGGFKVEMNKFYVYAYLRHPPSEAGIIGSPYYIGKGSGRRAFRKHKAAKPPQDSSRIQIISQKLPEEKALQLEACLINLYGRVDLGTGCLYNLTDGGQGPSKVVYTIAEKQRRAALMRTLWTIPEIRKRLLENVPLWAEESRKKLSASKMGHFCKQKGRARLPEAVAKTVDTRKKRGWWKAYRNGDSKAAFEKSNSLRFRAFKLFDRGFTYQQVVGVLRCKPRTARAYANLWRKEHQKSKTKENSNVQQ